MPCGHLDRLPRAACIFAGFELSHVFGEERGQGDQRELCFCSSCKLVGLRMSQDGTAAELRSADGDFGAREAAGASLIQYRQRIWSLAKVWIGARELGGGALSSHPQGSCSGCRVDTHNSQCIKVVFHGFPRRSMHPLRAGPDLENSHFQFFLLRCRSPPPHQKPSRVASAAGRSPTWKCSCSTSMGHVILVPARKFSVNWLILRIGDFDGGSWKTVASVPWSVKMDGARNSRPPRPRALAAVGIYPLCNEIQCHRI